MKNYPRLQDLCSNTLPKNLEFSHLATFESYQCIPIITWCDKISEGETRGGRRMCTACMARDVMYDVELSLGPRFLQFPSRGVPSNLDTIEILCLGENSRDCRSKRFVYSRAETNT